MQPKHSSTCNNPNPVSSFWKGSKSHIPIGHFTLVCWNECWIFELSIAILVPFRFCCLHVSMGTVAAYNSPICRNMDGAQVGFQLTDFTFPEYEPVIFIHERENLNAEPRVDFIIVLICGRLSRGRKNICDQKNRWGQTVTK